MLPIFFYSEAIDFNESYFDQNQVQNVFSFFQCFVHFSDIKYVCHLMESRLFKISVRIGQFDVETLIRIIYSAFCALDQCHHLNIEQAY